MQWHGQIQLQKTLLPKSWATEGTEEEGRGGGGTEGRVGRPRRRGGSLRSRREELATGGTDEGGVRIEENVWRAEG